jgi:hypothetical protein
MKKVVRTAGFFAKAEGAPSWRDRLAKMKLGGARKSTAKLEIDDANGEKLIFPEIGDVSEIAEGVAVTATDGTHVFVADTTTYTVEVLAGAIVSVVETPTEADQPAAEAMSPETVEFIEAVAQALEDAEEFKATANAKIEAQEKLIATMQEDFKKFKATMGHKDDKGDGAGADDDKNKKVSIGGKSIDLAKLNLK